MYVSTLLEVTVLFQTLLVTASHWVPDLRASVVLLSPCQGWSFHTIAGLLPARLSDPHQCMCFPGGDAYREMFPVFGT